MPELGRSSSQSHCQQQLLEEASSAMAQVTCVYGPVHDYSPAEVVSCYNPLSTISQLSRPYLSREVRERGKVEN